MAKGRQLFFLHPVFFLILMESLFFQSQHKGMHSIALHVGLLVCFGCFYFITWLTD
ncbi:MAG: hypothetical protein J3R72DRAFT_5923 [Linnemannia gamsii]|nr:MAG: hypothetical protein J3R72DRAFT_5923 [Linnemannia gamsii]